MLTISGRRPLSYRNHSIDLLCKSVDWFPYDNGPCHERVKLSFRSIVGLLMASNEDLNMKAKKARTFLYFLFLIFYLQYILVGIQPSNVESLGTTQLRDCRQVTFIILNRFFPLSKNHPIPLLFLTENIKMDRIPTKIK